VTGRHPTGLPETLAALDRTLVVGVVNVTPDSFSDGGAYLATEAAVEHGLQLRDEGADIVDVGGESTRPGAGRVDADEELRRILPVVRGLVSVGVTVSIDTMRAEVADAALDAGAAIVNDVSGGLADEDMARLMTGSAVPYVAMHWRGHSAGMASRAVYDDVVADVVRELGARVDALSAAGVDAERLVLDPGLGFAKDAGHNWSLLAHLDAVAGLGRPLLVGASRKGFLGALLAGVDGEPRPADQRDVATAALSALLASQDVWAVRVHAVAPTVDALRVVGALRSARLDG
jgi:dihydropteroate synthase